MKLKDKVAVVTGSARASGVPWAWRRRDRGPSSPTAIARKPGKTAGEIGASAITIKADVSKPEMSFRAHIGPDRRRPGDVTARDGSSG